jgi:ABC-type transporter Mla MlaB component
MTRHRPQIAVRAGPDQDTLLVALSGTVAPEDLPGLVMRVRALLAGSTHERILCDVEDLDDADAVTVDALARLQLAARRRGRAVTLLHASKRLEELLALCGLDEVIPPCHGLAVEARRQPEQREQGRRVKEEHDPGDRSV